MGKLLLCFLSCFSVGYRHDVTDKYDFTYNGGDNALVILIIGESARYDHFDLNGYDQPTSPQLDKISGLVSLQQYFALDTKTHLALPYMFMRSDDRKFIDESETGLISVFKSLGFKTYFLSMQGDEEPSIFRIASEADFFSSGLHNRSNSKGLYFYDKDLLISTYQGFISQPGKRLVVLHTMGSHFLYQKRVPAKYYQSNMSDYDNTIRYTDEFIAQVIQLADYDNAMVVYSSDHGESLAGDKQRFHGYPYELAKVDAPEPLHIPSFWYFSKKFRAEHQQEVTNLTNNASEYADQSYLFHSILGCFNIKSEAINARKNLCEQH